MINPDEPLYIRQIREAANKGDEQAIAPYLLLLWKRMEELEAKNQKLTQDIILLLGRTGILSFDIDTHTTGIKALNQRITNLYTVLNHLAAADENVTETLPQQLVRKAQEWWSKYFSRPEK